MFEHCNVEGSVEFASHRTVADPAYARAEELKSGYADAQRQFLASLQKASYAKATWRQILQKRDPPGARALSHLAADVHAHPGGAR